MSMWLNHVRLLEMLTPRYLKEFTCSRTLPFNHKVIESERLHLFLLMSITLHLLGLSVRWLSTDHFSISEMSSWSSDKSCLQDIGLYNIRSSAYRASILWCHGFLLVVWLTKSFCLNGHFNKTLQTTQQPKTLKGAAQQTFMYIWPPGGQCEQVMGESDIACMACLFV